ncbi:MAG: Na(+)-translocating NADH-quinone reductase subunit A [Lentimicrobiaceae bacterium]|nr:Na(+)-translocating NADH-quinone reductase subunit A [Lentimicrobiaceae bacterium]
MPKTIKLTRGLDIRLKGTAARTLKEVSPRLYAIKPTDFIGVFPRLQVKEGDHVKAGSPVFIDKYRENIIYTSPVSGTITEIKRGDKRLLLEIKIEADGKDEYIDFGAASPAALTNDELIGKLLSSGLWTLIRQRPYGVIANPDVKPKAIHISAFDTAPLAPDYDYIVQGKGKDFQTGIDVLARLSDNKVNLNVSTATRAAEFLECKNATINTFSGPHPAGNPGIQIHHLDPINKGEVVWVAGVQEVITIGRLFNQGRYNPEIIVALAGSEVMSPGYFKTHRCASVFEILKGNVAEGNHRYISGNVLTGTRIRPDNYLNFYDSLITVIPEGDQYEFLGWALPGLNKFSISRSFFSWLNPKREYVVDSNMHGGERAYVITGLFEKVLPMDIYPLQLIKSILFEDIDLMENLGIYEVEPEDFALCEFVDVSKSEIQTIIRTGLELMRKEMS